jgi:putative heme-binding domain-containing protein
MGKGACSACHRIGNVGNAVGPNLTAIGQIRSARDILESILFPSATIARDYEAHAIELANGQTFVAVINRSLPEAVVVADVSGEQRTLPRAQITSMQPLPTSLMPTGLDRVLTEEELLDVVAYLRSGK